MLWSQTLACFDFPLQASFGFQILSVEVRRDIRDNDELSRQIVTSKVGRDITIVLTRRTLLDLFDLSTYLRAVAYPSYYTYFLAAEALDKRHPKSASPMPVIRGSSFQFPRFS